MFKCVICRMSFPDRIALKRHIERTHPDDVRERDEGIDVSDVIIGAAIVSSVLSDDSPTEEFSGGGGDFGGGGATGSWDNE